MNEPQNFNQLHEYLIRNQNQKIIYQQQYEKLSFEFLEKFINCQEGKYYIDFLNNNFQDRLKIPITNPHLEKIVKQYLLDQYENLSELGKYIQNKFKENQVKFTFEKTNLYNFDDKALMFQRLKF